MNDKLNEVIDEIKTIYTNNKFNLKCKKLTRELFYKNV